MYDAVDYQERDAGGRWWALAPRRVAINLRVDVDDWALAAETARRAGTTVGAWVCDQIQQAYIDYATARKLPYLEKEDALNLEHKFLRVDFAVRSMACEMAQAAGITISQLIRAVIADALLQEDCSDG